jgi:hypothetical protein
MGESTTMVACDQHVATTVAAVGGAADAGAASHSVRAVGAAAVGAAAASPGDGAMLR